MNEKLKDFQKEIYHNNYRVTYVITFLLVLSISLLLFLNYPIKEFHGDSKSYWNFSEYFIKDGKFSIFNYADILRGFVLPLLLWIPRLLSRLLQIDGVTSFRIISAIFVTTSTFIVFPFFIEEVFCVKVKPLNRLLFSGLVLFFWYGHFSFPLSDMPSITFFVLGIGLCIKSLKLQKALPLRGLQLLFAGLLLSATTILRFNYQISFFVFISVFLISVLVVKIPLKEKSILIGLFVVGLFIPLSLQAIINKNNYDVISPFPLAKYTENEYDVSLFALYTGMNRQRADFGARVGLPSVSIPETQGQNILEAENISVLDNTFTYKRYIKLFLKHPFDFLSMYTRHLFGGLDVVYPSTYIPNVFSNQIVYRLINYSLWFAAITFLWKKKINFREHKYKLLILLIILIPVLLTIPGVVEVRYYLPLHILMYACVSFWIISSKDNILDFCNIRTLISYICFMAFCFSFSSMLFSIAGINIY